MSFNESDMDGAIIEMLGEQDYPHVMGEEIESSENAKNGKAKGELLL